MASIGVVALRAKSRVEAIAQLELLERTELNAIVKALGLHVKGSRNTLITSIIVRTHPAASKRPCGCPEVVVAEQEGF
jgi:hypothetical protein